MENDKIVSLENTRFIWETNFSGDPRRDTFGSDKRNFNVVLPVDIADQLASEGFNIKHTTPKDNDDYEETFYVKVNVNFESKYPPRVYLVTGDNAPEMLDTESVGLIDGMYIKNVNCILSKYYNPKTEKMSLYLRTLYAEQEVDNDPFAARYRR